MHTHILIPTDGSDLSDEAIQYGTALAKAVNAKLTGVTVSPPIHVLAVRPEMVADTIESYTQRMATVAAQRSQKCLPVSAQSGVSAKHFGCSHLSGL